MKQRTKLKDKVKVPPMRDVEERLTASRSKSPVYVLAQSEWIIRGIRCGVRTRVLDEWCGTCGSYGKGWRIVSLCTGCAGPQDFMYMGDVSFNPAICRHDC